MVNWKLFCVLISITLAAGTSVFAQGQAQQGGSSQVIDIEAQVIDARVELPQVQILDKRKKSDFDEVKVEKSFKTELSGKTEELKFTPVTSGKIRQIKNIDELVNKKRF